MKVGRRTDRQRKCQLNPPIIHGPISCSHKLATSPPSLFDCVRLHRLRVLDGGRQQWTLDAEAELLPPWTNGEAILPVVMLPGGRGAVAAGLGGTVLHWPPEMVGGGREDNTGGERGAEALDLLPLPPESPPPTALDDLDDPPPPPPPLPQDNDPLPPYEPPPPPPPPPPPGEPPYEPPIAAAVRRGPPKAAPRPAKKKPPRPQAPPRPQGR